MTLPATTPIADAKTKAAEAPINTGIKLPGDLDAKSNVASCVLSPSSARNTIPKTVTIIFKSIYGTPLVSTLLDHVTVNERLLWVNSSRSPMTRI
jgi:hypothetical protein